MRMEQTQYLLLKICLVHQVLRAVLPRLYARMGGQRFSKHFKLPLTV